MKYYKADGWYWLRRVGPIQAKIWYHMVCALLRHEGASRREGALATPAVSGVGATWIDMAAAAAPDVHSTTSPSECTLYTTLGHSTFYLKTQNNNNNLTLKLLLFSSVACKKIFHNVACCCFILWSKLGFLWNESWSLIAFSMSSPERPEASPRMPIIVDGVRYLRGDPSASETVVAALARISSRMWWRWPATMTNGKKREAGFNTRN